VIDEVEVTLAVCRRLDLGEAWQSGLVDAAELAVAVFTFKRSSAARVAGYLAVQSRPVRVRSCARPAVKSSCSRIRPLHGGRFLL
jgi:hypothetical protein